MMNLKKVALNITSKFGLLNTYRPLVLTISEERQVHETLLKLILVRVNAGTSILKWAKEQENQELKDSICRLYDINLMWAQVQREYAEKSNALGVSLREILQIEAGLDALRKQLKDVSEKKERLVKASIDSSKKKTDNASFINTRELEKLTDEEDELKSELDVKTIKAEIFKSTAIKKSLTTVMDANLELAKKMELIFTTSKKVLENINEVPNHLKKNKQSGANDGIDIVLELAASLNIERSLSSVTNDGAHAASVFHVDRPHHPKSSAASKTPEVTKKQISGFKKAMGKLGLERPLPVPPSTSGKHSNFSDPELHGFVMVSNVPPPTNSPPPIPIDNFRRRSKSHGVAPRCVYAKPFGGEESSTALANEELHDNLTDDDDTDDYIEPISESPITNRLYRSSSDSHVASSSSTMSSHGYCEPWENYAFYGLSQGCGRDRSNTENVVGSRDSKHHYEKPYELSKDDSTGYGYSRAYEDRKTSAMEGDIYNDPLDLVTRNTYTELDRGAHEREKEDEYYSVPFDTYHREDSHEESCLGLSRQLENDFAEQNPTVQEPNYMILEKEEQRAEEGETYQSFYQNSAEVANELSAAKILSKPDDSHHHLVIATKSPIPLPRRNDRTASVGNKDSKNKIIAKKISCPAFPTNFDTRNNVRKLKPKPLPRPKSTFYDEPSNPAEKSPVSKVSVRDMAIQLKEKIKPAPVIPSLTQNTIKSTEYVSYRNDLQFP